MERAPWTQHLSKFKGTVSARKTASASGPVAGNSKRQRFFAKENDKSLQAVAEGHLREDLNSSIEILGAKLVGKVHVEGKEKEYLTITVTGRYDYGLIVSTILNEIQSAVGKELPGTKVDVKGKGSWTKIGVVVRTDGTHSYMAVAFQIRNPDYK